MHCKQWLPAVLFFLSTAATAQTGYEPDQLPKDVLKVNLSALAWKNVSVQYEYVVSKKMSVALGGRLMANTALPFKSLLMETVAGDNEDAREIINKSRLGNFAITPEARFYFGKGWGQGFYIAPYYRFAHFSSNTLTVNYSDVNSPKRSVNLSGELNAHTGGVLFGAQWLLGSRIVLDWWILGVHYGTASGSFSGIPYQPLTEGEQAAVQRNINEIDIPMVNKDVTVTANSVLVKTTGAFGGLRSGLCLGIRF